MNLKTYAPYIIVVLFIVATVAITFTFSTKSSVSDQTKLSIALTGIGLDADLTTAKAIENKDYTVCAVSKTVSVLSKTLTSSLATVETDACHIPTAKIDLAQCHWAPKLTLEVVETPTELPVPTNESTPAPPIEEVPVTTPSAEAALSMVITPLVFLVQGQINQSEVSPAMKAWATGTLSWIEGGRPAIQDLIQSQGTGTLEIPGTDIQGCQK